MGPPLPCIPLQMCEEKAVSDSRRQTERTECVVGWSKCLKDTEAIILLSCRSASTCALLLHLSIKQILYQKIRLFLPP